MALDVYFREDIKQGIVAVAVAMLSAAVAHDSLNMEYCRGVLDVSRAQVLNYGLSWPGVLADLRGALTDAGRAELVSLLARTLPGAL